MAISASCQHDIDTILAKRHDLGGDFWTTPDRRLIKGSPFSFFECVHMLLELGMEPYEPILKEAANLLFSTWREDGRFRLSPDGGIYPCQTATALRLLCYLGYASDPRVRKTFEHLMETRHSDGGWRCKKFSYGKGPETDFSNPGPTLTALDGFRFYIDVNQQSSLDTAVEFLLHHWTVRMPICPCHYGIGTLFQQVAYPFFTYNLFFYVYVLSFYDKAKTDTRFLEALKLLESKLEDGKIIVERPNRKLADFTFCKKGEPSVPATMRYQEILKNLGRET